MKIVIEQVDNGAIVTVDKKKLIYEYDEEGSLDGLKHLLYEVYFNLTTDRKWAEYALQIRSVHGSKYECHDKNCKICKGDL